VIRTRVTKRTAIVAAIVLLGTATGVRAEPPRPELRGVWINHYAIKPQHAGATLQRVIDAKLNTVYLRTPTIRTEHGDNLGMSDAKDFAAFLDAAKKRGLSVHGWITNKRRLDDKQVDFTDPAEQRAQSRWAVDLLNQHPLLDGVHLDYIRYTKWEHPDATKMAGVTNTVRAIRAALRKEHAGKRLTAAVFTADPSYLGGTWGGPKQWEGDVPKWYRSWHGRDAKNHFVTHPPAAHAAGRFKDFNAKHLYGPTFFHLQQDPVTWLADDLVDAVLVMQYTADAARFDAEVRAWRAMLGDKADRVHMGLGWLTEKGQPDWRRDPAALARHIRSGRKHGVRGFCVFTLGVPQIDDRPLVEALRDVFNDAAKHAD